MLTARIIPCLDTKDGRVVKGVRFSCLRDAGSPEELAAAYEAQGADELVVLDISATDEGRSAHLETVRLVRQVLSIPLTTGGGVRSALDAGALLEAGADKVSVNTAAVSHPALLSELARLFGSQCTVLALDAACRNTALALEERGWEVVVRSGKERTGIDVLAWASKAEELGAGEILLTSWDRDGTRSGYDLDLLRAISSRVSIPIIASGGANSHEHFAQALAAGASAVLAASMFHDGDYTVSQLKHSLSNNGIPVRL